MYVPSPTSRSRKRVYLSFWDLFWAVISPLIALYLRDEALLAEDHWGVVGYYWLLSTGSALVAFFAFRLQDGMTRNFSVHEALDIAEAVLIAGLMSCAALFTLTRLDGIPRSMPLIHGLLLAGGLMAARIVVRIVSEDEVPQGHQFRHQRTILIGGNRFGTAFIQLLKAYVPYQQPPVIAVLDDDPALVGRAVAGVQVLGAPHELEAVIAEFAVHGVDTDRVVIAGEANSLSQAVLREIERICQKRQIELSLLPRLIGMTESLAAQPVAATRQATASAIAVPFYFRVKRWIDILGSLGLLVVFSPLLLIAGVLVLFDVGPPVLFWQERVGWRGRSFLIYKFRTLGAPFDTDGNPILADRQPSGIGRFLRASRIDELPQLLNVLLGDMSLIGPRPLLPEDQPANTAVRLSVRPGITGWAQIHGAKLVTKERKEALDEWYVRNASFWLDLRIVLRTIGVLLRRHLSPEESTADSEQVQSKGLDVLRTSAGAPAQIIAEHRRTA